MKRTTLSLSDDLALALTSEAHPCAALAVARDASAKHHQVVLGDARSAPFAALGHSCHRTTGRDMEQLLEREWGERHFAS